MKKEVLVSLQFILIIGIVSSYFYLSAIFFNVPESMREVENRFLKNCSYSFITLSLIRLGVLYFTFLTESCDLVQPSGKYLIEEISKTIQYLIIAVISIFVSFGMTMESFARPNYSINILSVWDSMNEVFLGWTIAFSILSLLRVGIIYIVRAFSKNN